MEGFRHSYAMALRFNDSDAHKHVNNITLFTLFDNAKYRYFLDLFGEGFFQERGIVIASLNAEFHSPVFYPGEVVVYTAITKIGHKSFQLIQKMYDSTSTELKCETSVVMVIYDTVHKESLVMSDEERKVIRDFEGSNLD